MKSTFFKNPVLLGCLLSFSFTPVWFIFGLQTSYFFIFVCVVLFHSYVTASVVSSFVSRKHKDAVKQLSVITSAIKDEYYTSGMLKEGAGQDSLERIALKARIKLDSFSGEN
ncbi:hypothetical protein V6O07_21510 [Arthrospira platensis SPKY2]